MKIKNNLVKVLIALIVFSIIFSGVALAYETDDYKIDISSNYHEVGEASFNDNNGRNININVLESDEGEVLEYTEQELDTIIASLDGAVEELKTEYMSMLKETYGNQYSDEILKELIDTIRIDEIIKKEVTTFGKGKYNCFHLITQYNIMDSKIIMDQYTTYNNGKIYTVTLSAYDVKDFETAELKDMVSSFEFKNAEEEKPSLIAKNENKVKEETTIEEVAKEEDEGTKEALEETLDSQNQNTDVTSEKSIWENELLPIVIVLVVIVVVVIIKMCMKNKKANAKTENNNDDNNDSPIQ